MNELGLYFLQRDKKEGMRKEAGRKKEIKKKKKQTQNTASCQMVSTVAAGGVLRVSLTIRDRRLNPWLLRTLHSAGHVPGQQPALQAACLVGLAQPHTGFWCCSFRGDLPQPLKQAGSFPQVLVTHCGCHPLPVSFFSTNF